jgi:hypothetical protein
MIKPFILNQMPKKDLYAFFLKKLLSENTKKKTEKIIVYIAIFSFILHLSIIALVHYGFITTSSKIYLLNNPIAAIYTPFSFILIYEVYLLVYYLPKSTSIYIGKQYEIITLILIRKVFKDLSKLELNLNWFKINSDLYFTVDLIVTLILFFLIFVFYKMKQQIKNTVSAHSAELVKFIHVKNIVAMCLIPLFLFLAFYSFSVWIYDSFFSLGSLIDGFKDVNKVFFSDFFTFLILIDVLLLLLSFLHTSKFNLVIRNSGFIISTILIKLSFNTEGILNPIIILVAVLFGVFILAIHNQYEKLEEQ